MLETILLWSVIIVIAYLCGYSILNIFFCKGLKTEKSSIMSADMCILSGFAALTVYVQFFSLFYKVGFICFMLMLLIVGSLFILSFILNSNYYEHSPFKYVKAVILDTFSPIKRLNMVKLILSIIIIFFACLWTSLPQNYYDTWFYHSQAIRWFEEYGVIKGLGNLHCRFAYNSSFMGLQALFGFRFLRYPSYHVVNGIISVVFALFALLSNKLFDIFTVDAFKDLKGFVRNHSFSVSDFTKLSIFYWIFRNAKYMSSCQTDDLAMLLIMYIISKWLETSDSNLGDNSKLCIYCILSVFGVWALTVKLSAATTVLLAIYPAALLIKNRKIREIVGSLISGIVVVLPWLIRNIIISGWLIYPFPTIDLFDVEWKMPAELAVNDNAFIREYARNNWRGEESSAKASIFMLIGFISLLVSLIITISQLIKKNRIQESTALIVVYIGIAYWLFSAPAIRFGEPYLSICILYASYKLLSNIFGRLLLAICTIELIICFALFLIGGFGNERLKETLIHQFPYSTPPCRSMQWEGMTIYYPEEGYEIIGYGNFPAFNYSDYFWDGTITDAELMGDNLKDGVRWKD